VRYYDILGLKKNASQDEIKRAYRKLVRQYHPDHHPGTPSEKIQTINEAYAVLSDPQKRRQYDLTTGVRVEPPPPKQPGTRPPSGPVQGRTTQTVETRKRTTVPDYGTFADYPEDAGWGKLFYYLGLMALIGICQLGFLVIIAWDDETSTSRPLPTASPTIEESPTVSVELTTSPIEHAE
jgi:hypothetical protein